MELVRAIRHEIKASVASPVARARHDLGVVHGVEAPVVVVDAAAAEGAKRWL
jgi:hypothetical protein